MRRGLVPLDPGREWLPAGITGIPRQREWDAVATTAAPATSGDEVEFVALPDGRLLGDDADATPFAAALEGLIEVPYRAVAVRREELWAVGARRIEVAQLDPNPDGDDLELTWDGASHALAVDGAPAGLSRATALERLAASRVRGRYAAHAHRLEGDLWEIHVLPL
ncbi:MAG: hypothetical protein ACRDNY_13145 [Gaiellaceae bacterium]